ncbi:MULTISPECIES: hypothetical protein [Sorangium]|uniref:Uncharacterized protein n=1 Tax=Sorangium cellulosum (strain So ce56) TaxID=448385 RepID=A9F937_SORC5|nr:hypothetical protein [Sorangium cellulosum]CAN94716.1 hypothetical protein predicted by Glimmer/Critica [Sorangium cellulosum So ce56]
MPKAKSASASRNPGARPAPSGPFEASLPPALSAAEQDLLGRALRFLVNVQAAPFIARARREGYAANEHREGWRLFKLASGEQRPLEHLFAEAAIEAASGGGVEGAERMQLLREVDVFENTWFPRTRAIIRRVVPRERRDGFEAAFFKHLEPQPLGSTVTMSVGTYLRRLEGLARNSDGDAKKVHKMLAARGLTEAKVQQVRDLLAKLEAGAGSQAQPPRVPSAELARAWREQREGIEGLQDWFNDWATTLRQVFPVKAQIQLGLTAVRRTAAAGEVIEEEVSLDEDEGADGEVTGAEPPLG